ncbi:MAG: hypothetical protein K2Q26_03800 [Bdellovibrionales bacterium]|nr:hypothetical protein [Bdellovibrionales bacterium]
MKFIPILCFLFLSLSASAQLLSVEANCWNSALDSDGSFLCQYVVMSAKEAGINSYIYPELRAPDGDGPLTLIQADRACALLGFRYAIRFELESPGKERQQILFNQNGSASLELSPDPFIQHINCGD